MSSTANYIQVHKRLSNSPERLFNGPPGHALASNIVRGPNRTILFTGQRACGKVVKSREATVPRAIFQACLLFHSNDFYEDVRTTRTIREDQRKSTVHVHNIVISPVNLLQILHPQTF